MSEKKEGDVLDNPLLCQKDNIQIAAGRGCLHPKDYCRYRQACLIHFLEQEKARDNRVPSGERRSYENSSDK
jgi:hypothetical protein